MRYDPKRRSRVMAWLAEQGIDITAIPQLAKPAPTPQASEGVTRYSALHCSVRLVFHHENPRRLIMSAPRVNQLHSSSSALRAPTLVSPEKPRAVCMAAAVNWRANDVTRILVQAMLVVDADGCHHARAGTDFCAASWHLPSSLVARPRSMAASIEASLPEPHQPFQTAISLQDNASC